MSVFEDSDFHDAVLKRIDMNYEKLELQIEVLAFKDENSTARTELLLRFFGLASFLVSSNCKSIERFSKTGNINSWLRNEDGKSYLYLVNGIIEIECSDHSVIEINR